MPINWPQRLRIITGDKPQDTQVLTEDGANLAGYFTRVEVVIDSRGCEVICHAKRPFVNAASSDEGDSDFIGDLILFADGPQTSDARRAELRRIIAGLRAGR